MTTSKIEIIKAKLALEKQRLNIIQNNKLTAELKVLSLKEREEKKSAQIARLESAAIDSVKPITQAE